MRLHACGPVQAGMHPGPRDERQCLKAALIADCNNWRTQELSDFIGNNWEKQAIVSFHLKNPLEGYRRPTFHDAGCRDCGGEFRPAYGVYCLVESTSSITTTSGRQCSRLHHAEGHTRQASARDHAEGDTKQVARKQRRFVGSNCVKNEEPQSQKCPSSG